MNPQTIPVQQRLLIVISGPAGVGKDSVVRRLQQRNAQLHFVVTTTTRARRSSEVEGVDYNFCAMAEFVRMIDASELLEYAVVYGEYKGVPKQQVAAALASGKDVVMRLDVQGAARIKQLQPAAVLIFLTVESEQELERRLAGRQTETEEKQRMRLAMARQELQRVPEFDYCVPNDDKDLGQAVAVIEGILVAERHKVNRPAISL